MELPAYPGPRLEMAVERASASLPTLLDAARNLLEGAPEEAVSAAVRRGWFRPLEEEALIFWFARFLTVRDGLWETLSELVAARSGEIADLFELPEVEAESGRVSLRAFVLGYLCAAAVVRLDRFLIEVLATHSVTQRKLNEGVRELRIPRKRYTFIFEGFTDPQAALMLDQAIEARHRHRAIFENALRDPLLSGPAEGLAWVETGLDRSRRRFLRLFARYKSHAVRRRFATMRDHGFFSAAESSGRMISEVHDRWQAKRVTPDVQAQLSDLLEPGDVLVTRHERALTNLILPGFWPHAALYVGGEGDRRGLGVELDAERRERWSGDRRVLEALKDGVRFRPLEETLAVDAVAVLRPRLSRATVALGLARAAVHEGKGYNFDFDFFRSDRLVCTEVVYRAFDGLDGFELQLSERAGRPTLSAEDLLDQAFGVALFDVVAVYGVPPSPRALLVGSAAKEPLRRSFRGE